MKRQINSFFTALIFFTRIPSPIKLDYSPEILNRSSRYYSLIGLLIGAIAAGIYYSASFLFSVEISILLSMISTVLVTGAFHEDGFADSCDGLGGGYEKERILEIMKDSRIGTFGAIGLLLLTLLKFLTLTALNLSLIIPMLLIGHCLSRALSAGFIFTDSYVSSALSKSKPLANRMRFIDLFFNLFVAYTLFFVLFPQKYEMIGILTLCLLLVSLIIRVYIRTKIGGYTGDILGAIQQILEVFIYLFVGSKIWPLI